MDRGVLDRLLLHTGTLASIYHQPPETFIRNARPKQLQPSPALDPESSKSFLDTLNLPKHIPPTHIETILPPSQQPPALPAKNDSPITPTAPALAVNGHVSNEASYDEPSAQLSLLTPSNDPALLSPTSELDPYAGLDSLANIGSAPNSANSQYAFGPSSAINDYATDSPNPILRPNRRGTEDGLY